MGNYIAANRDSLSDRHYILLANQSGYWFGVAPSVINKYRERYGDDFCLVLFRSGSETDAYVMPFDRIGFLFTEDNLLPNSENSWRWVGSVEEGQLQVRRTSESVSVADCHNAIGLLASPSDEYRNRLEELTPVAEDIEEPTKPERVRQRTYRILRDTSLARKVKQANDFECQLCGSTLELGRGKPYTEAHHVKPLGAPHDGPDVAANILCVCPNHHVLLDYGAIAIDSSNIEGVAEEYISYHNRHIFDG